MKLTRLNSTALSVAVCLTAMPALAGSELEMEVTDHRRDDRVHLTKIQAEGLDLRIEVAPRGRKSPGGTLLFQGDRREGKEPRVVFLDAEGGHTIINQEKIDGLVEAIPEKAEPFMNEEMIERARAQLEQIADPEARARAREQFEARFGPAGGAESAGTSGVEFVERGVRDKLGYPCVRYDALRDGERVAEIWATDWANLEGGRETGKAFAAFESFYSGLMERLAEVSGFGGVIPGVEDSPFFNVFELERVPVATYEYEDGELVRSTVLKRAGKVDLDPAVFKIPPSSVERQFGTP